MPPALCRNLFHWMTDLWKSCSLSNQRTHPEIIQKPTPIL
jgi:hypothetical protein